MKAFSIHLLSPLLWGFFSTLVFAQSSNPCELSEPQRLLGNTFLNQGGYATAKQHYEDALSFAIACTGTESTQVADINANLGIAILRLGDYQQAMAIQEKALMIRQKILPHTHPDIAGSYMNLGEIFKKLEKFDEALFYYEKAFELLRLANAQDEGIDIAYAFSEIGQSYLARKDYEKAKNYFERENDIMVRLNVTDSPAYSYTCADFASLYMAYKDFPKAIEWFAKMVSIWRAKHKNPDTQLGSMLLNLGRAKVSNGDFALAVEDYLEAKNIYEMLLGPHSFLGAKADASLATAYRRWYLKVQTDSLLDKARDYFRFAITGAQTQLLKETSGIGQRKLIAEFAQIHERAISSELMVLKKQPHNREVLERAWQLSEAMHAQQLFAATQEANARHFAGIQNSELMRDSVLNQAIVALQNQRQSLLKNQEMSLTDSLVLAINAEIFDKKDESVALRAEFEKKYPDYFRLKYELQNSSLAKTQQMLSPQQTLLEYFVGDFDIFIFVVQQSGSRVIEIPRNFPLAEWVEALREGISGYHTAAQKTPALYKETVLQYADAAQKLYEKLLAPIAESLTSELIIVPGDALANLPFEALLSSAPKDSSKFNTFPFLLRSHSVQYAYSATMLHQMMDRQHRQPPAGGLLAFAPFFEEDTTSLVLRLQRDEAVRRGFCALPFSGEEIFRAKRHFGRKSMALTGKEATKQKFLEMAAGYKILHLATHGKANHKEGDFSYLAFASGDENVENGLLSVGELYNLPLNADLVLLSACETGIGEQLRGEGVISLARAFAFAGAKSIITSLWSVNDKSTMLVMDYFYAGIKSGKPKNVALADAKLKYLENNPGQKAHPFFWAGFVGVGDMGVIKN